MEIYRYWLLLALILMGLEMITGTFYLLALSIAMAVASVAALFGASIAWQISLCAVSIIIGTIILRRWKNLQIDDTSGLDIGQDVQVLTWSENGSARVLYRGAEWNAQAEPADMPRTGPYYIKEIRGSALILTHQKP